MSQSLKVAIVGFGTVGSGTYRVLSMNAAEITRRVGFPIEVVAVASRTLEKVKVNVAEDVAIFDNPMDVVKLPDVDVVVELMGGTTLAKSVVLAAIAAGKHVVTANKALLALHAAEIFSAAQKAQVMVAFEAAVAGGIPVIKAIKEGLAANQIETLAGIINGTCNFILSEMRDKGLGFAEVLSEAQRLGYAEADPTFDIEGIDAAHKLSLLSSLAFGTPVWFEHAHVEGITKLQAKDIRLAEQLGYRIKLLGISKRIQSSIELRVHPTLIPAKRLLANVNGVMNAVYVHSNAVGPTLFYGPGAGSLPTASSVVADLIELARQKDAPASARTPMLAFKDNAQDGQHGLQVLPMAQVETGFYLRLQVDDKPGVLADLTHILAKHGVSVEAMLQNPLKATAPNHNANSDQAEVVFLTHRVQEGAALKAIAEIEQLPTVHGPVVMLRVEDLG